MSTVYKVSKWNELFENYKSREQEQCRFACVPNKQHGMGFTRVLAEPDGLAIYGAWCCIVGACSQQRLPRDGWLTDNGLSDGTPWSASDLALKFHKPETELLRAIEVLSSHRIGWLLIIDSSVTAEMRNTKSIIDNAHPGSTRRAPDAHPRMKEGIEENEEKEEDPLTPASGGVRVAEKLPQDSPKREPEPLPGFDAFWAEWPPHRRKADKAKCVRRWKRHELEPQADTVIAAVKRWKCSTDWTKSNGDFIPAPLVWLNKSAWEVPAETLVSKSPQGDDPYGVNSPGPSADEIHRMMRETSEVPE